MTSSQPQTGGIVKHSTIYAIGNLARQLVGFLMLPIYTRYLAPADYGVVGLLAFALALLEPFFGARLAQAVPIGQHWETVSYRYHSEGKGKHESVLKRISRLIDN